MNFPRQISSKFPFAFPRVESIVLSVNCDNNPFGGIAIKTTGD